MFFLLLKLRGAFGIAKMIPPFPSAEVKEDPMLLTAVTVAVMLEPQVKRNGDCVKLALGIVQFTAFLIVGFDPLQLAFSVEKPPSACLN